MRFEQAHGTQHLKQLDLPWAEPLGQWTATSRKGLAASARHLVHEDTDLMLREVDEHSVDKALQRLKRLADYGLPALRPVGAVRERGKHRAPMPALLVTEWPQDALTLEEAIAQDGDTHRLADALANLTAHLHLAGFAWGEDCCREVIIQQRDTQMTALLSAATGAFYSDLSEARREADLNYAVSNLTGVAPDRGAALAEAFQAAYQQLWRRIRETRLFEEPEAEIQVHTRVIDMQTLSNEERQQVKAAAGPPRMFLGQGAGQGEHHRVMLHMLTGLDAGQDGGRRLLRDIFRYRSFLEFSTGRPWPRALAANRWMNDVYQPALASLARLRTGEICH